MTVKNALMAAAITAGILGTSDAKAEIWPGVISSVSPEVSASTLGVGPEADLRLSGLPLGLRLGANFLSFDQNISTSDVTYHGNIDLANGGVIADWYPFAAGFRLSAGVKINGNNATVTATPSSLGTITVNHQTYAAAGSQITGKVDFDTVAPYAGLGFGGQIFGGPTLAFDIGAMFHGTPRTSLTASGAITTIPGFAANLAQEQQSLQDKVKDFIVYPVLGISLGWRF